MLILVLQQQNQNNQSLIKGIKGIKGFENIYLANFSLLICQVYYKTLHRFVGIIVYFAQTVGL